jgi:hypothetical protein
MTGQYINFPVIDGSSATRQMLAWDDTGSGPYSFAGVLTDGSTASAIPAVKASLTAPSTTDPALVVSISPNSINVNGIAPSSGSAPVVISNGQTFLGQNQIIPPNGAIVVGGQFNALPATITTSNVSPLQVDNVGNLLCNVQISAAPQAKNVLWYAGATPYNGLLTAAVTTLISTELVSLASSATATSTVTGASGIFTSSYTGQAQLGEVFLLMGSSIATALSAGANISGWFLTSPNGTTFEATISATPQPRPPDFIIPMPTTTINAGLTYKAAGLVNLPALNYKVFVQNNTGQALGSSATALPTITVAPIAQQY